MLRRDELLVVVQHTTDYGLHEQINRMVLMFNFFSDLYDPGLSGNAFRPRVRMMSLSASFVRQFGLSSCMYPVLWFPLEILYPQSFALK